MLNEIMIDVVVGGLICLDMTPHFDQAQDLSLGEMLKPGALSLTRGTTFSTGGVVSNTGFAMKRLGLNVGYAAKVGGDVIGQMIIDKLDSGGNAEGIKVDPDGVTSHSVVLAPPGIDRIFLHCPGTNDTFAADDIDWDLVGRARLFHFGYPTLMRSMYRNEGRELARLFRNAKRTGVCTSLDISLPDPQSEAGRVDWRRIFESSLPNVDLFVPSIEEAYFLLHPESYRERCKEIGVEDFIGHIAPDEYTSLANEYLALGCKVIVLKAGSRGWYVKTSNAKTLREMGRAAPANPENWGRRELWCPAFRADRIASATGAGDCSIAAFLTALLRGHCIEETLKLANAAGWQNLQSVDALSGLSSWEDLTCSYPDLPIRDNSFLIEFEWSFNKSSRIWERHSS